MPPLEIAASPSTPRTSGPLGRRKWSTMTAEPEPVSRTTRRMRNASKGNSRRKLGACQRNAIKWAANYAQTHAFAYKMAAIFSTPRPLQSPLSLTATGS